MALWVGVNSRMMQLCYKQVSANNIYGGFALSNFHSLSLFGTIDIADIPVMIKYELPYMDIQMTTVALYHKM